MLIYLHLAVVIKNLCYINKSDVAFQGEKMLIPKLYPVLTITLFVCGYFIDCSNGAGFRCQHSRSPLGFSKQRFKDARHDINEPTSSFMKMLYRSSRGKDNDEQLLTSRIQGKEKQRNIIQLSSPTIEILNTHCSGFVLASSKQ